MRAVVVGAGAWGLPAAAELARRGHRVTCVDRAGPGHALGSSSGPTRLWRLADHRPSYVRLARHAVASMERLERRTGIEVHRTLGLLWRDAHSSATVAGLLQDAGIGCTVVDPGDVGRWLPGLRPDGRPAVWVPDAGVVLAEASLRAQQQVLADHGGTLVHGRVVVGLDQPGDTGTGWVTVHLDDGSRVDADVAVLAPGPWAGELLATAGIDVALQPYLEQVVHFGRASRRTAHDQTPCFFDGPTDRGPGMYAMPTPGVGYKVGIDRPLRPWRSDDLDRTPDAGRTAMTAERVRRDLLAVPPEVLDAQVCSWTDSPDGRFVVDRVGSVVVACGDSGEGFKFSALMGEVLADVAEDREPLDDIETFSLDRFRNGERPTEWTPTTMGG